MVRQLAGREEETFQPRVHAQKASFSQFHTNSLYKLSYEKAVFERFCKIKQELRDKQMYGATTKFGSEKLLMHIGEGSAMLRFAENIGYLVGGMNIKGNANLITFS